MKINRTLWFCITLALIACVAVFDVSAATLAGGVMIAPAAALAEAVSTTELETVTKEFKATHDEIRKAGVEVAEQLKKGELQGEARKAVDDLLTKYNTLSEQITTLEQLGAKAKEIQDRREQEQKSTGHLVIESKSYEAFKERGFSGSMKIEQKVVSSTSAAGLIQSYREPGVLDLPRREMTVRDLLTVIPITTSSVDYAKQLTRTNAAAPVAEQAAKPYSDYTWGQASVPVRTIAHLAKLTRQALDDAPRLQAEVDSEMRYGLDLVEEAQLLNGDGTGQNLHGLMPQATAYATPAGFVAPDNVNKMDVVRIAMLQLAIALRRPDGIVLNDIDWTEMELTKSTDGVYLMSQPNGQQVQKRLWNLPLAVTQAMAADNFLVGNFRAQSLYDRMTTEVLISTENADDFEKNLATMRAEKRLALAVKVPAGLVKGVFSTIIAALNA